MPTAIDLYPHRGGASYRRAFPPLHTQPIGKTHKTQDLLKLVFWSFSPRPSPPPIMAWLSIILRCQPWLERVYF